MDPPTNVTFGSCLSCFSFGGRARFLELEAPDRNHQPTSIGTVRSLARNQETSQPTKSLKPNQNSWFVHVLFFTEPPPDPPPDPESSQTMSTTPCCASPSLKWPEKSRQMANPTLPCDWHRPQVAELNPQIGRIATTAVSIIIPIEGGGSSE